MAAPKLRGVWRQSPPGLVKFDSVLPLDMNYINICIIYIRCAPPLVNSTEKVCMFSTFCEKLLIKMGIYFMEYQRNLCSFVNFKKL